LNDHFFEKECTLLEEKILHVSNCEEKFNELNLSNINDLAKCINQQLGAITKRQNIFSLEEGYQNQITKLDWQSYQFERASVNPDDRELADHITSVGKDVLESVLEVAAKREQDDNEFGVMLPGLDTYVGCRKYSLRSIEIKALDLRKWEKSSEARKLRRDGIYLKRWGLTIKKLPFHNTWIVCKVDVNSIAEKKGVHAGDEIISPLHGEHLVQFRDPYGGTKELKLRRKDCWLKQNSIVDQQCELEQFLKERNDDIKELKELLGKICQAKFKKVSGDDLTAFYEKANAIGEKSRMRNGHSTPGEETAITKDGKPFSNSMNFYYEETSFLREIMMPTDTDKTMEDIKEAIMCAVRHNEFAHVRHNKLWNRKRIMNYSK